RAALVRLPKVGDPVDSPSCSRRAAPKDWRRSGRTGSEAAVTDHVRQIDDITADEQIAQVITALEADLGDAAAPQELEELAVVAYRRVSQGARVRSFLPVLAEREAR